MPAPHHLFFYRLDALPVANQQRQSTEGQIYTLQQTDNDANSPTPHPSVFYRPHALSDDRLTVSEH